MRRRGKKLTFEEVSWMAEKKINHNNGFFFTIGSAFVFFFLSFSKYLKHFPLPFHGGSQCHGAMIEKWIWKKRRHFVSKAKVKISLDFKN